MPTDWEEVLFNLSSRPMKLHKFVVLTVSYSCCWTVCALLVNFNLSEINSCTQVYVWKNRLPKIHWKRYSPSSFSRHVAFCAFPVHMSPPKYGRLTFFSSSLNAEHACSIHQLSNWQAEASACQPHGSWGCRAAFLPFDSPHQQSSSIYCIHKIYTLNKTEGGLPLITHLHNGSLRLQWVSQTLSK